MLSRALQCAFLLHHPSNIQCSSLFLLLRTFFWCADHSSAETPPQPPAVKVFFSGWRSGVWMTKLVCFSWLGDFGVVVGLSDQDIWDDAATCKGLGPLVDKIRSQSTCNILLYDLAVTTLCRCLSPSSNRVEVTYDCVKTYNDKVFSLKLIKSIPNKHSRFDTRTSLGWDDLLPEARQLNWTTKV